MATRTGDSMVLITDNKDHSPGLILPIIRSGMPACVCSFRSINARTCALEEAVDVHGSWSRDRDRDRAVTVRPWRSYNKKFGTAGSSWLIGNRCYSKLGSIKQPLASKYPHKAATDL